MIFGRISYTAQHPCFPRGSVTTICIHRTSRNDTKHYRNILMGAMAFQITSLTIVYSTVYLGADHRNRQSSASLACVRWIHRWPVNSPHIWPITPIWPITRQMFPFDDVIMLQNDFGTIIHWASQRLTIQTYCVCYICIIFWVTSGWFWIDILWCPWLCFGRIVL